MAISPRLALALLAALGCGSCLTGGYYRTQMFGPVAHEQVVGLVPGKATLDDALKQLGAPLYVWEWKGEGTALAWGWRNQARWGFALSVPVGGRNSASFSYDKIALDLPGAVLFFESDGVLVESREGQLADIQAQTSVKRPAAVPENAP
ncbi:MAG: hypothetical protein IPJ19_17710 [Planctomycetes bacterium]|nr:hypothetical protein [Planctomycetota bacterium]